ncbi:hypothetical protein [Halotia branconii]|uniref:Lipoprotein n=1 Tax=Halotia branconii CENA392 TaxID=1539056 RepID=A0AAJ6NML3_9CYAN|nr:hypothetical protein [Halotia branconii]WGV23299.1 hypothetical protein QI031_15850 [Halotia branconii CENA392]
MNRKQVLMVKSIAILGLVALSVTSCNQTSDRNTQIKSNNNCDNVLTFLLAR